MPGLSSLIADTTTSSTTMPSWYDQAQQNVVNQAQAGAAAMPQLQNTVAGGAIQNLSGANNPFFTAQGQLSQIGSGAANPWITDASGNVTPNTQTALGGLFAAQNKQLEQTLPTQIAPAQASAIGSGNFGSLRGQTAVDTAKANALANLQSEQMKAALQSQQTGINAAQALGNVGATGTTSMTQLGQAQQTAPLTATADLAKILSTIKAPQTVTEATQLSPLSQIGALGSALGGPSGLNSLIGSIFPYQTDSAGNIIRDASGNAVKATVGSLGSGLGNLIKGSLSGAFNWFSDNTNDSGVPGSTVTQADVNSFLQQYPEYADFMASQGYQVSDSGSNPDVQD